MSARGLAPGIGIGEFVLVSLLGAGATATVFIAEREGRRVALKVLNDKAARDPQVRAAFLAEARRAADLRHPNVVPLIASGETDGRVYIASRLVEGGDLRRAVAWSASPLAISSTTWVLYPSGRGRSDRAVFSTKNMTSHDGHVTFVAKPTRSPERVSGGVAGRSSHRRAGEAKGRR